MHCLSKSSSKLQSHKLICVWCMGCKKKKISIQLAEAAGTGQEIQPTRDLTMLRCALSNSHSDLPGVISLLALNKAFDIWADPFFISDILGLWKLYLFSAMSSEEWQEGGWSIAEGAGEEGLYPAGLASLRRHRCCSHISPQPLGLVAWLASHPPEAAGVSPTTSPWPSLQTIPGKSFPGASSQPAGGCGVHWVRLRLLKHVTEGSSLMGAREFRASVSGFLLSQALVEIWV